MSNICQRQLERVTMCRNSWCCKCVCAELDCTARTLHWPCVVCEETSPAESDWPARQLPTKLHHSEVCTVQLL